MRTVLAAAAAGALILGSAAGAMADAQGQAGSDSPIVKFRASSIKGHSPINV